MAKSLGIDIGGSGIKGALVDVDTGSLVTDRLRIPTPQPSTPEAVAGAVDDIVRHFEWTAAVGVTFPAVVRRGVILTAANVDDRWIGTNADAVFTERTGCEVTVLNDADAAGIAEIRAGAGRGQGGVVLVLTFGTGIGSGLFIDGVLVPNTELGHLELDGAVAEHRAAGRIKDEEGLTYPEWGRRVSRFLSHLERLFAPDLFIIGGGISKRFDRFHDVLEVSTPVVPAALRNQAGIVGAAMVAKGSGGEEWGVGSGE